MVVTVFTAALGAAGQLTKMVAQKVQKDVELIRKFDDQLTHLKLELEKLKKGLDLADGSVKSGQRDSLQDYWIRNLRDAVLDGEDIVEICAAVLQEGHKVGNQRACTDLASLLEKICSIFSSTLCEYIKGYVLWVVLCGTKQATVMRDISPKIQGFVRQLEELQACANQLNSFKSFMDVRDDAVPSVSKHSSPSIDDEDKGVDIEPKRLKVMDLLTKKRVAAVTGLEGSGKTRLLQHVFKFIKSKYQIGTIKPGFHPPIWLCISCSEIRQLQKSVLGQLHVGYPEGESQENMREKIKEKLKGKKCLVALDDIWELTQAEKESYATVLEKLREIGLPEDEGCKVLISTKSKEVARQMKAGDSIYEMELLSDESSKDLFFKHLTNEEAKEYAKVNAKDIGTALKRCGGLPMAIISMANLLNNEQDPSRWAASILAELSESSSASASSYSTTAPPDVAKTNIKLSYHALDLQCKRCFAFMGILKEDEEIESDHLIGMWKAERLVQTHEQGYVVLKQLCNRFLVSEKEDERRPTDYIVKRMHTLVREVALDAYMQSGGTCSDLVSSSQHQNRLKKTRRICVDRVPQRQIEPCPESVRTLRAAEYLILQSPTPEQQSSLQKFLHKAHALRGLRLNLSGIDQILKSASLKAELGCLRLLRFLDISDTPDVQNLPDCVRSLTSLEYLYTAVSAIPSWITDLQRLTHFSASQSAEWSELDKPMPNLQVVKGSKINIASSEQQQQQQWTWDLICQHKKLELVSLQFQKFEPGKTPRDSLKVLVLHATTDWETFPDEWGSPTKFLQCLELCRIKYPTGHHDGHFRLLRVLVIKDINCEEYPAEIADLRDLRHLHLQKNSSDKILLPRKFGSSGKFPNLRSLRLEGLGKLRELPALEDGAMPQLRSLLIKDCPDIVKADGWNKMELETLQISDSGNVSELFKSMMKIRNFE